MVRAVSKSIITFTLISLVFAPTAFAQSQRPFPQCPEDVDVYLHTRFLCDTFNDYLTKDAVNGTKAYARMIRNVAHESYKNTSLMSMCGKDGCHLNPKLEAIMKNPWFNQAVSECFGGDSNKIFRFHLSLTMADILGKEFIFIKVIGAATAVVRSGQIVGGGLALIKRTAGVLAYRSLLAAGFTGTGVLGRWAYKKKQEEYQKIVDNPDATWLDLLQIKGQKLRVKDQNGCWVEMTLEEIMELDPSLLETLQQNR